MIEPKEVFKWLDAMERRRRSRCALLPRRKRGGVEKSKSAIVRNRNGSYSARSDVASYKAALKAARKTDRALEKIQAKIEALDAKMNSMPWRDYNKKRMELEKQERAADRVNERAYREVEKAADREWASRDRLNRLMGVYSR